MLYFFVQYFHRNSPLYCQIFSLGKNTASYLQIKEKKLYFRIEETAQFFNHFAVQMIYFGCFEGNKGIVFVKQLSIFARKKIESDFPCLISSTPNHILTGNIPLLGCLIRFQSK